MLMDYSTITFPGLGLELNPNPIIDLGFTTIRWYGLIIAVGLMLACVYGMARSKKFGLREDDILDGVLWIVPFAIVCARAYYCIFSWDRYAPDPISVLYIWKGGLAIPGGIIGTAIGIIVFCRIKKISTFAVFDLVALGFLIGQCIGRWGNFFNREAYGCETDFFLRMGLFQEPDGSFSYVEHFYHPTFLYESVWNAIGFAILHFASKKRQYDGQIALGYVAWYGFGRTFTEALRASTDALKGGDLPVTQILGAVACVVATGILFWQWFRPHDRAKLYVNAGPLGQASAEAAEEEAVPADAPAAETIGVSSDEAAEKAPEEATEGTDAEVTEETKNA